MTTMNEARVGFEAWLGITPKGAAHDLAYEAFKAGTAWQRAQGAVPDGYMPIPTVEQLADALANVRCFHGLSAELIAPELLRNLLAAAPAHLAGRQEQGEVHSAAARDVLAERKRQITVEDFDASHDEMATRGQIAMAAGLYAIDAANLAAGRISLSRPSALWPWPEEWWKPAGSRRNLVKAGALILAEIERLDRAALAAHDKQSVGE